MGSDSGFRKVSIENSMYTWTYFRELQRQTKPLVDLGPTAQFYLGYDVYMLKNVIGYKTTGHILKRIWNSKHQIFSEKEVLRLHCIRYGSICL